VGRTLNDSHLGRDYRLIVLGIDRGSTHLMAPPPSVTIQAEDRLLVQGGPERAQRAAVENGLAWRQATVSETELLVGDVGVAEVAIAPRSSFVGRTLRELGFRERFGLTAVALWRGGRSIEFKIADESLRPGDALLVQGPWSKIRLLREQRGLILLSEYEDVPHRTSKAPWAILILVLMVFTVVCGLLPLEIATLSAATLTVLTGCLQVDEARKAVEWHVVLLIAGMLAFGTAMQRTGAAEWIALTLLGPVASLGPLAMNAALMLITGALTMWISNHAASALVAPIAMSVAVSQGMDPRSLLMAVALGTTTALITPFAHPSFILIMGPGGYRFRDYTKIGLPLCAVICVTTLIALSVLYPA